MEDEQRDKYADALAAFQKADETLKNSIKALAHEHGANPHDVANLIALKRDRPDEFNSLQQRVSQAATQAGQSAKATRAQLQQARQALHEALQRADASSPAEKLRAFQLLGQLNAQLEKMMK